MRAATILAALALYAPLAGCVHRPTEKEQRAAENHYDLGVVEGQRGNSQMAMREYQMALELDESFPEAHDAIGQLLHNSFHRPEDAIRHYKRALEIKPDFSKAKLNLGNVYLDLGKYDEAILLYDQVLNDMLYEEPYLAHSNRGWSLYKKGDVKAGMESIQMAITTNPKFCLGHKLLGLIHNEQGEFELACNDFRHFRDTCPDAGDAYYLEGVCLTKLGKTDEALKAFVACQTKTAAQTTKDACKQLEEKIQ
ncbi:MAG TPA: social motility TPR repeat lipoprotein Tgl [Myxococcaceae bacterium]|jgi:tetratricopeptide (TPR) repeat protein